MSSWIVGAIPQLRSVQTYIYALLAPISFELKMPQEEIDAEHGTSCLDESAREKNEATVFTCGGLPALVQISEEDASIPWATGIHSLWYLDISCFLVPIVFLRCIWHPLRLLLGNSLPVHIRSRVGHLVYDNSSSKRNLISKNRGKMLQQIKFHS